MVEAGAEHNAALRIGGDHFEVLGANLAGHFKCVSGCGKLEGAGEGVCPGGRSLEELASDDATEEAAPAFIIPCRLRHMARLF